MNDACLANAVGTVRTVTIPRVSAVPEEALVLFREGCARRVHSWNRWPTVRGEPINAPYAPTVRADWWPGETVAYPFTGNVPLKRPI